MRRRYMHGRRRRRSPLKQHPKKSTESAHGQLSDAEREYQRDLKRIDKGKYWYKVDGKKVSKHVYNKYKNVPGKMEGGGKTTNDPDPAGIKAKHKTDRAKIKTKTNKK